MLIDFSLFLFSWKTTEFWHAIFSETDNNKAYYFDLFSCLHFNSLAILIPFCLWPLNIADKEKIDQTASQDADYLKG